MFLKVSEVYSTMEQLANLAMKSLISGTVYYFLIFLFVFWE